MTQRIFAFKGTFGQFETYTGSIPTQRLGAMFSAYFADALDANDPMLRAQRVIDMGHVRRINGYLDRSVRAFGSPIATAKVISETPVAGVPNLVEVELTDIYLVDGQKRVKSCILRAEQDPEWNETIPLHVVGTEELIHKQQLFASINGTAAKVSPSLNAIYDHSNPLGGFITMNCPAEVMESEKATVSKTSDKLVTQILRKRWRACWASALNSWPACLWTGSNRAGTNGHPTLGNSGRSIVSSARRQAGCPCCACCRYCPTTSAFSPSVGSSPCCATPHSCTTLSAWNARG